MRKLLNCSSSLAAVKRRKGFAAGKPKQAKKKPRVSCNKEVHRSESIFSCVKGSIDQKTTLGFAKAKKPLLW